jgi:hypothetical protein
MNNDDSEMGAKISLSKTELKVMKEKFGLDLSEPNSLKEAQESLKNLVKLTREFERKAQRKMHPDKEHIAPEGAECSFCYKAENEVKAMIKHDSGNCICNECIQSIQEAEGE